MLYSGEKTKLLVVSNKELRAARLVNKEVTVNVKITESSDDKPLGIVISNNLTYT